MIIVLDWETLVTLLVKVPHAAGVVVRVITYGMRTTDAAHQATHLSVGQWSQDEVIVIGHQLKTEQFNLVNLKSFVRDWLESLAVPLSLEDFSPHVYAIQGVVKPARLVSPWWSRHGVGLLHSNDKLKRPDPFSSRGKARPPRQPVVVSAWRGVTTLKRQIKEA